jgi:hypothetical protein
MVRSASLQSPGMRTINYLWVIATFVLVATATVFIIQAIRWEHGGLALVMGAIAAAQVGAMLWYKDEPTANLLQVKLRLGLLLSIIAVLFSTIFQQFNPWLESPEVAIPIAAVGCFAMPFAVAGQFWNALAEREQRKKLKAEPKPPDLSKLSD